MKPFTANISEVLKSLDITDINWISKHTAILVVHGIGNQLPLETIDQFGRGLIQQYEKTFGPDIYLEHALLKKADHDAGVWFDNALRIKKKGSDYYLDVYEYYWANYTEDKANTADITKWINGVVKGSTRFYSEEKNAELGKKYHDKNGIFFDKNGNLVRWKYRGFLWLMRHIFPFARSAWKLVLGLISWIPFAGKYMAGRLADITNDMVQDFDNIIGDIVVYNVTDPKNKYYSIKRAILDGAVKALKFLIEKEDDNGFMAYPSVIVAGHSLGSQVSYDAINKINLMVNEGEINTYLPDGTYRKDEKKCLADQLNGYITFGSPLDKIAFFLREIVPDKNYIRQQMLDNYHCFKQQNWSINNTDPHYLKVNFSVKRLLENIQWRNYFDYHDPVSGSLDFYAKLVNIDCHFRSRSAFLSFTHSYYWESDDFFKDIIIGYLGS